MHKPSKQQYVSPKLKEHGAVRELTQSSSGDRSMGHYGMHGMRGMHHGMGMRRGSS
jgi:hypothetical protein